MSDNSSLNSKKLAKNTIYLYVRLLLTIIISLYTSKAILKYLGVEDFGIYNVVGGLVSMYSIVSGSLSASISRNLTYELGKGNMDRLNKIFSMSINIQVVIIMIVYILGETIGLWFLNYKMVIPAARMEAANWVYQISLFNFALNLIGVPYNASLIAHEKMATFAYIGVLSVVLKLIVVFMLTISPIDKLIFFSIFLLCISFIIQCIYQSYCRRHFEECCYKFIKDKGIFNEMFGFAIWNFIGSTSGLLRTSGVNILLNLFFGPVVNAARAIATQVDNVINSFVSNFMVAITPQITKAYAQGNYGYILQCIYRGSKLSYFLLFLLSLPIFIETEYILNLWLDTVPETTVWFVRFVLLYSLVDTYSRTMINANNATGDIKVYQLVIGIFNLTVLPIAYIVLRLGAPAESSVLVSVVIALISIYPRIYFIKKHIPITYKDFTNNVFLPTVYTSLVGFIPPYLIFRLLPVSMFSFVIVIIVCLISALIAISFVGCTKEERYYVLSFLKEKFNSR